MSGPRFEHWKWDLEESFRKMEKKDDEHALNLEKLLSLVPHQKKLQEAVHHVVNDLFMEALENQRYGVAAILAKHAQLNVIFNQELPDRIHKPPKWSVKSNYLDLLCQSSNPKKFDFIKNLLELPIKNDSYLQTPQLNSLQQLLSGKTSPRADQTNPAVHAAMVALKSYREQIKALEKAEKKAEGNVFTRFFAKQKTPKKSSEIKLESEQKHARKASKS